MISIDLLKIGRLCDLEEDCLFIAVDGKPIVAGKVEGDDVFAILTAAQPDREPFEFFPRGKQPRRGFIYRDLSFEVDQDSAHIVGAEHQLTNGQLVLFSGGIGIAGHGVTKENAVEAFRGIIELKGRFEPEGEEPKHLVGFSHWRIMVGEGEDRIAVFALSR